MEKVLFDYLFSAKDGIIRIVKFREPKEQE